MALSKGSKMLTLINYRLRITLADSRVLTGQMLAFDRHMNLVLADCEEFRRVKAKSTTKAKETSGGGRPAEAEEKRTLGLVILRGENIVSLSVDGPPPPTHEELKARATFQAAGVPGGIRPPGRGLPMAPGGVAPGLQGPVRGVGGPAPGMMMPQRPGMPAAAAAPVSYARPPMLGQPPMPGQLPPRPPMGSPLGFRPPMGAPPPPMGAYPMPTGGPPGRGMPVAAHLQQRPPMPGGVPPPGFQGPPGMMGRGMPPPPPPGFPGRGGPSPRPQ